MSKQLLFSKPVTRNIIGIIFLLLAWYLPDRHSFAERDGFQKLLPYLLLLTMYGWIVVHNRLLIDKLYFSDQRKKYFIITGLIMIVISLNIFLTIRLVFVDNDPLPQILGFWVFTIAGAGIYLLFRYRDKIMEQHIVRGELPRAQTENFDFTADGRQHSVPVSNIAYIESLENYIKVFVGTKTYLVRMSMKQAEQKLSPTFIRISKSHLVNIKFIESQNEDSLTVGGNELKVGKVYKEHVRSSLQKLHFSI